jgi:hypothetical protein
VVYRCEGDLCPDLVTEILEHGTIEILGIVDGDLLRNSVAINDALPENILDGGEGVISLCWCRFAHDIDAPPL